jgi:hypothetical protein
MKENLSLSDAMQLQVLANDTDGKLRQMLEKRVALDIVLPDYPAINALIYAQYGQFNLAAGADSFTIQVPQNALRLVGLGATCNTDETEAAPWLTGLLFSVTISTNQIITAMPFTNIYLPRNNYPLGYMPFSRPVNGNVQFVVNYTNPSGAPILVNFGTFFLVEDTKLI